jgi:phage baseplate assembly protein W
MTGVSDVAGTAYPFRIDPATGGFAVATGAEKVRQDLQVLLTTRLGERGLGRDFGTRLPSLVHDPNDDVLADVAVRQTAEAVLRWEPRVTVTSVDVDRDPDAGEVRLILTYRLIPEQTAGRLVVPLV